MPVSSSRSRIQCWTANSFSRRPARSRRTPRLTASSQERNKSIERLAMRMTEGHPILAPVRTPYVELSKIASVEAHRKNIYRPPYYVHKWWARRTGSVFRGLLLDLLLDEQEDVMEAFYRRHDFSGTTILDPFMGGGTTVG